VKIDAATTLRLSVALASLALAQAATAQSTAPQSAVTPESTEIVVTAAPPDQQQRIDRKIFVVKDNAQAQTSSALDVLRRVPSITVNAKDQVQLLGDAGVKILIDGHPVADVDALKVMTADQIAKVEVSTNPSAAYTAEAVGGIINIISRHSITGTGLGGVVTAAVGSFGATETKLAPSYSGDRWSAALSLDLRHNIWPGRTDRERTAADPALALHQVTDDRIDSAYFASKLALSWRPRPSTTWTLDLSLDHVLQRRTQNLTSLMRGSHLAPASEDVLSTQNWHHNVANLGYGWTGKRRGESLAISGHFDDLHYVFPGTAIDRFDSGTQTSALVRENAFRTSELKLDYVHPMFQAETLSLGGALTHVDSRQTNGLVVTGAPAGGFAGTPPIPLTGTWTTLAAYATFQFPIGQWKIMPGLRAEQRVQNVASLGATGHREGLLWFPSLHVDRKLTKRLDFAASYSRRVAWPILSQLNPAFFYTDLQYGEGGNPNLRPELTDSFETSLTFTPGKQSLALKLYDKETSNVFAFATQILPSGVVLATAVNAGHASKRGGEFTLSGPIWKGWHYSASADLALRRSQVVGNGGLSGFDQFAYGGNFQIEYQDKAEGKPGANHILLEAQYSGPVRDYQYRAGSWLLGSLNWTHSYNARLSSIVKITDVFASYRNNNFLYGDGYTQIDRYRFPSRTVMVSLVSKLGKVK
jgi:ferric enterobactin receptor